MSPSPYQSKSKVQIQSILNDAWLGMKFKENQLFNPLYIIPKEFENEPHIYTTYLMTQPDYFSFLCSEILNVKLLPIQSFILKEMFNHKFPMLIMSRGAGKCITGNSLIITDNGIKKLNELVDTINPQTPQYKTINILGNNSFNNTEYCWYNGYNPTIKVKTYAGFEIEGTYNHPVMSVKNDVEFVNLENLKVNDYIIINRKEEWFNGHDQFEPDECYLLGLLVGDGGYTVKGRIGFTTADEELATSVITLSEKYFGKSFKKQKAKYTYNLYGVDIWNKLFEYYGFNSSVCGEKSFPSKILSANKECVKAFIQGLFDTDGYINKKKTCIEFSSKSPELCRLLQFILTKFGIISKLKKRLNKKYNRYYHYVNITGYDVILFQKRINFRLNRKKHNYNIIHNTNNDIIPISLVKKSISFLKEKYSVKPLSLYDTFTYNLSYSKLYDLITLFKNKVDNNDVHYQYLVKLYNDHYYFDKIKSIEYNNNHTYDVHIPKDHTFLSNGFVSHNSYLLAVYALIRAITLPGRKIVIAGSTFRQSKIVFEYIEGIYRDAPILRDIISYKSTAGAKHDTDMWRFYCGESVITSIPIGSGDGIRGLRANDIIADEFKCLRSNTLCETDKGLIRIQSLKDELIINRYGQYEKVIDKFISKNTEILEVRTKYGYSIQCSPNHRILTKDGWKQAKEITSNDSLAFTNAYIFPKEKVKINDTILDKDLAWLFGFLIAEGSLTSKYSISITNTNKYLIQKCIKIINRFNIKYTITKRKAYLDNRGWKCKKSFVLNICSKNFRDLLYKFGLEYKTCYNKKIPWSILQSPKEIVISFLNGLFTGDGSCFNFYYKNKKRIGCSFYSVSEVLMRDVHTLLFKLNIISHRSTRISKISKKIQHFIRISGIKAVNFIQMLNDDYWNKYLDGIDLVNTYHRGKNRYINDSYIDVSDVVKLNLKEDLYDITTESTHSFYADGFIQHNSHDRNIFETVIAGFGAVSANPVDNVKYIAKKKMATELGIVLEDEEKIVRHVPNQIILSGTAYYQFNHFYDYFKKWKSIIKHGHNKEQFERIFGDGSYSSDINSKDYCVIRIPIELIPEGFMDSAQIARSKATMHSGNFGCEYGATFSADSNGFFKRSLIQSCTVTDTNNTFNGKKIIFYPTLVGDKNAKYVIGIDPASEEDNFAITVIELHEDHKRVVYSWTITRKEQKARLADGSISVNDYFGYCAKKIRELMRVFPPVIIGIDSQGGGYAVMEALVRTEGLAYDEKPIYELIEYNDPKDTDPLDGLHLIKKIQFADAKWMSEANNSLRLSLENKRLLFPHYDALTNTMASYSDSSYNRLYDTLEDVVNDIEEMKDELSTIIMTSTESGRDKWTTPDKKDPGMKKGKMRKDRYTALLIANYVADLYLKDFAIEGIMSTFGGFAYNSSSKDTSGPIYNGPAWFTKQMEDVYE